MGRKRRGGLPVAKLGLDKPVHFFLKLGHDLVGVVVSVGGLL